MSDHDDHPMDPLLAEMLEIERQRPEPPAEVATRVHARVLAAVGGDAPPDGGSPDGAPPTTSPPTGSSVVPASSARLLQGLVPRTLFGLLGTGAVIGAILWALSPGNPPAPPAPVTSPADAPATVQLAGTQGPLVPSAESKEEAHLAEPTEPIPQGSPASTMPSQTAPAPTERSSSANRAPTATVTMAPSVTPRTVNPAPTVAPAASHDRPSELEILRRAEQLGAGDPSKALVELEQYERLHRQGQLAEEAAALEIELLVKNGAHDEARQKIASFRRKFPGGAQLPRVLSAESKLP